MKKDSKHSKRIQDAADQSIKNLKSGKTKNPHHEIYNQDSTVRINENVIDQIIATPEEVDVVLHNIASGKIKYKGLETLRESVNREDFSEATETYKRHLFLLIISLFSVMIFSLVLYIGMIWVNWKPKQFKTRTICVKHNIIEHIKSYNGYTYIIPEKKCTVEQTQIYIDGVWRRVIGE